MSAVLKSLAIALGLVAAMVGLSVLTNRPDTNREALAGVGLLGIGAYLLLRRSMKRDPPA